MQSSHLLRAVFYLKSSINYIAPCKLHYQFAITVYNGESTVLCFKQQPKSILKVSVLTNSKRIWCHKITNHFPISFT
nr:hypothetical protein Iba_chr04cCG1080 [Ipomoea batatas]